MSVIISVPDPLAAELTSEAQQQQISVEQLATNLLARALHESKNENWDKANQRRLALLHKSSTVGLAQDEAKQLQQLQALADQRLEALDAQRLAEVERMEQEVKAALQEAV